MSQVTSGSPGWPAKRQLSGIVRQHLRKDVLRTERLAGRGQLLRAFARERTRVGIGYPEQRALGRGLRQEVGHLLGEPVDGEVAVLGVIPFGREIEVVDSYGSNPGLPAVAVREPGFGVEVTEVVPIMEFRSERAMVLL